MSIENLSIAQLVAVNAQLVGEGAPKSFRSKAIAAERVGAALAEAGASLVVDDEGGWEIVSAAEDAEAPADEAPADEAPEAEAEAAPFVKLSKEELAALGERGSPAREAYRRARRAAARAARKAAKGSAE